MSIDDKPPQTAQENPTAKIIPASDSIGQQVLSTCHNCGVDVIMQYRTIHTYCYKCGVSITHLGVSGLYYELDGLQAKDSSGKGVDGTGAGNASNGK